MCPVVFEPTLNKVSGNAVLNKLNSHLFNLIYTNCKPKFALACI